MNVVEFAIIDEFIEAACPPEAAVLAFVCFFSTFFRFSDGSNVCGDFLKKLCNELRRCCKVC